MTGNETSRILFYCRDVVLLASQEYSSGRMFSSELKQILIDVLTPIVLEHQKARLGVTDDIVGMFMTPRKLIV